MGIARNQRCFTVVEKLVKTREVVKPLAKKMACHIHVGADSICCQWEDDESVQLFNAER